jgi:hypothetical protein
LAVEIITPLDGYNNSDLLGKRASKPTSKKRDYLETNIDIEETKVKALTKRRKNATKLDDSTQACDEIDDLAGTLGRTLAL